MCVALQRYGRQQQSEIDSWYVDDLFLWFDRLCEMMSREGLSLEG